ncbi:MAG: exosome complex protein Rrp42 [Nanoarchaeota archaeon]|nr:exosome complex protein Rrp42 [Nanoarchaeota archaeon]
MSSMEISSLAKENLRKMFSEGKRFDYRGLLDYRDFEVTYDVSNKAEGSARVKLGKTEIVVGIKLTVGAPYPDSKDKGNLMVSGDLLPIASPRYESGPPGFNAIELPRLVDRAIRGSEMIDLKRLVIKEGEKVWTVIIDIYPINDDGNIVDAATIGVIAALKKTFLPTLDSEGNVDYETKTKNKLPLSEETAPLSFSFYKLGDSILLDPTREEEEACDSRITFGISKWEGQYMINSCQKRGEQTLNSEEIAKIMDIIPKKFEELNKKLKKFL